MNTVNHQPGPKCRSERRLLGGQHQRTAGVDGEVEAGRDVGGGAVLDDQRRPAERRAGRQAAALEDRHGEAAAEAGVEHGALADGAWARARARPREARRRLGRVVASTTQLMISISALGMWRAKRRVYSRSKSARKVAASARHELAVRQRDADLVALAGVAHEGGVLHRHRPLACRGAGVRLGLALHGGDSALAASASKVSSRM